MTDNMQIAIPQAMREIAEKNMDQARAGYSQLMDAARKVQEMMTALIPSNPALQGLIQAQERAMKFARQNAEAGFSLADELTKAATLPEMLQIQSRHAQLQIQAYALQANEIAAGVNGAAQKAGQ
ncbi:MAG: phasin family protein [Rhodomicrobium sp.]